MSLLLGYQNILTEKGLQIETQPHLEGPEENRREFAKARFWEWGPHRGHIGLALYEELQRTGSGTLDLLLPGTHES